VRGEGAGSGWAWRAVEEVQRGGVAGDGVRMLRNVG
jgi:hypothetical protein